MNVLALDLGTTTGWAYFVDGNVSSGSQSFAPSRFDGGGVRYLKFRRWLDNITNHIRWEFGDSRTPLRVAFESVRRHQGVDAGHAYGGFLGMLTAWCEEQSVPYEGVPVGTIKRFMTGNGAASKEDMVVATQLMGYDPQDDNEADALGILEWCLAEYDVGWKPRKERRVARRSQS